MLNPYTLPKLEFKYLLPDGKWILDGNYFQLNKNYKMICNDFRSLRLGNPTINQSYFIEVG